MVINSKFHYSDLGDSDEDFCIQPPTNNTLVLMGNDHLPYSAFPLGECQGDCDYGKLELRYNCHIL